MKPVILFLCLFTLSLMCLTCSAADAGPPVWTLTAPAVESAAAIPVSAVAMRGCEAVVCRAGPRSIVAAPVRAVRAVRAVAALQPARRAVRVVAAVQPLRRVASVAAAVRPVRRAAAIVRAVQPARRAAKGIGWLLFFRR